MNEINPKAVNEAAQVDGVLCEAAETAEGNSGGNAEMADKLSTRNLIMFPLGTFGRDFVYNLFSTYLITYILFTKTLTDAQFASISFIIIAARIFDAFNDPIMGGLIENTHTRFGKFKPWILSGAILTGVVIAATFSTDLQGWAFIGFLAFIYFMFSIVFTMNDISYWGMMPSLTRNSHDRSKLTSFSQIVAGAGGGLVGLIVPMLTAGQYTLGGSAVTAYRWIAIVAAVLMIGFQLFTVLGVKEKPLPAQALSRERITIKQMFKTIFKNDQLMWTVLILLCQCIGPAVAGGLCVTYIYFEFGYNGSLLVFYGILSSVMSTLFTLLYPWLAKRFGRKKLITLGAISMIFGFLIMLIFGLVLPANPWQLKFAMLCIGNGLVGAGSIAFYMILVISVANTVEYNEWKTGNRDEGLIFSLRPFTAKMGSAFVQFFIMLIYLAVGVTGITNQISDVENAASRGAITDAAKLSQIEGIINSVPQGKKFALLICMCVIPILFIGFGIIVYRKKCILDEATHAAMVKDIEARAAAPVPQSEAMAEAETAV